VELINNFFFLMIVLGNVCGLLLYFLFNVVGIGGGNIRIRLLAVTDGMDGI